MEGIVYKFNKNSREQVCAAFKTFREVRGIDLRVCYRDHDGNLKPGEKGLWLKVELLPELKKAVLALEQVLVSKVPLQSADDREVAL